MIDNDKATSMAVTLESELCLCRECAEEVCSNAAPIIRRELAGTSSELRAADRAMREIREACGVPFGDELASDVVEIVRRAMVSR